MQFGKKAAAVAIAATVVLGGAGVAAWAESGTSSPATVTATQTAAAITSAAGTPAAATPAAKAGTAKARAARARALLRRVDHATLEVKDKTGAWITVDYDRGQVTSLAGGKITLARPDGKSVTLTLTPTTTYTGAKSASALTTGKGAAVISNSDGTARQVIQPTGAKRPNTKAAPTSTTVS